MVDRSPGRARWRPSCGLVGCTVVSLDEINARRGLQGGAGLPIEEWERTHQIAVTEAQIALHQSRCVVVDDTSSMRFLRDRWRLVAEEADARFRPVLVTVADEEWERRRERAGRCRSRPGVEETVMRSHLASFEDPSPDEQALTIRSDQDPSTWIGALEPRPDGHSGQ